MDERTRAVARLWTRAQPNVSAFVASQVRDFRDRDDVLQEIAVAVVDAFDSYDPDRPFIAWALGIARNQIRHYLRARGRERHVFDDEAVGRLAVAFAEVPAEEVRALDFLEDCLKSLDGRARRICDLRYREDLKPAAIAGQVGMSANSVAKALQRVRDALRDCVARKAALEGGMP